jgi:hypothetical protein
MADVKISDLPAGTAAADAIVPATNAAGTTTEKVTLGSIAALGGGAPAAHAASHQTGGSDVVPNVVVSPAEITANTNNYAIGTGDIFRLTADAARNITGIVARADGDAIVLINVDSADAITLKHASTDSTDVNRILVPWEGDYVLAAKGGAALLIYDGTTDRWRVI